MVEENCPFASLRRYQPDQVLRVWSQIANLAITPSERRKFRIERAIWQMERPAKEWVSKCAA
jgi:hypothetical protein